MKIATITVTFYGYIQGVESHTFFPPYRDTLDQKYYLTGWETESDIKKILDTLAHELHYLSGHGIDSIAVTTKDFLFTAPYAERYVPYDDYWSDFGYTLKTCIGDNVQSRSMHFCLPRVDAFSRFGHSPTDFQQQIRFFQIKKGGYKKRQLQYDCHDSIAQSFSRKILSPNPILYPFTKTFAPLRWHREFQGSAEFSLGKLPKRQMSFYKIKAKFKKEQEEQRFQKRLKRAGLAEQERRRQKKADHVYIIQMKTDTPELTCKIGVSNAPEKRLKALQTSNPFPLEIVHSFIAEPAEEAEKCLHDKFHQSQLNGEWFQLSQNQLTELQQITNYQQGEFIRDTVT